MATSKSGRRDRGWIGGAFLYSGRADPTWSVPGRVAAKLHKVWESLPLTRQKWEPRSGLGYRGAFLRGAGDREWVAFNKLVSLRTPAGIEVREDTAQKFEKTLLSSAPRGLLPEDLLQSRWTPA